MAKRIKSVNGFTIYKEGPRSERTPDTYSIYYSADIREYGLANSDPNWEDIDTLEEALEYCAGNGGRAYDIVSEHGDDDSWQAREAVEGLLDCGYSADEIAELLDADVDVDDLASCLFALAGGTINIDTLGLLIEGGLDMAELEDFVYFLGTIDSEADEVIPELLDAGVDARNLRDVLGGYLDADTLLELAEAGVDINDADERETCTALLRFHLSLDQLVYIIANAAYDSLSDVSILYASELGNKLTVADAVDVLNVVYEGYLTLAEAIHHAVRGTLEEAVGLASGALDLTEDELADAKAALTPAPAEAMGRVYSLKPEEREAWGVALQTLASLLDSHFDKRIEHACGIVDREAIYAQYGDDNLPLVEWWIEELGISNSYICHTPEDAQSLAEGLAKATDLYIGFDEEDPAELTAAVWVADTYLI